VRLFTRLYKSYTQRPEVKRSLAELHSAVKAQLEVHDPAGLRVAFNVDFADLAIAGGGAKSLYAVGAYFALQHAGISIARASGTSSGAYIAALLLGTRYKIDDLLQEELCGWGACVVQTIHECKTVFLGKIWAYMSRELRQRLDGWLPEANELSVSITTVSHRGLVENLASDFSSPEDLQQSIRASMSVPFILCDGPFSTWRGQRAIDGGFKNNCPVSILHARLEPTSCTEDHDARESVDGIAEANWIIVKVDANAIKTMPLWRKILHVAYAPMDFCNDILLEGTRDMLEILSLGKQQLNGITVIDPRSPMQKRDFSYQLFPGIEHVDRFRSSKSVLWNVTPMH